LGGGKTESLSVPKGHTTLVFVLSGRVKLAGGEILSNAELGVLDREGEDFTLAALEDSKILILAGEPIPEPVVGYGPFVMNSWQEIKEAFEDFEAGRLGQIARVESA
jgi:redox-sensitive bicupin YhaK (pirin superfamily)